MCVCVSFSGCAQMCRCATTVSECSCISECLHLVPGLGFLHVAGVLCGKAGIGILPSQLLLAHHVNSEWIASDAEGGSRASLDLMAKQACEQCGGSVGHYYSLYTLQAEGNAPWHSLTSPSHVCCFISIHHQWLRLQDMRTERTIVKL